MIEHIRQSIALWKRRQARRDLARIVAANRNSEYPKRRRAGQKAAETRKANVAVWRSVKFASDPLINAGSNKAPKMGKNERRRIRKLLVERDGLFCHYCNCRMHLNNADAKNFASIEHIMPHSMGGTNHPNNLVLACVACNCQRSTFLAALPVKVNMARAALHEHAKQALRKAGKERGDHILAGVAEYFGKGGAHG